MNIWRNENNEFCKYIKFASDKTVCSNCVNLNTQQRSIHLFEQRTKKIVKLPFMHIPGQECQGGGIYQIEYQCEKCEEGFCETCILRNHKGFRHICMNCSQQF